MRGEIAAVRERHRQALRRRPAHRRCPTWPRGQGRRHHRRRRPAPSSPAWACRATSSTSATATTCWSSTCAARSATRWRRSRPAATSSSPRAPRPAATPARSPPMALVPQIVDAVGEPGAGRGGRAASSTGGGWRRPWRSAPTASGSAPASSPRPRPAACAATRRRSCAATRTTPWSPRPTRARPAG